ncbi:MAG: hypothetical protein HZA48_08960 [Planctomycetes bacterium]|nr:hypothetical protein [Planctomycetota bacterium]
MSLEMYLTFLALVVAVYSILTQTQKSALAIFFPSRCFVVVMIFSFLVSFMPYLFIFWGYTLCFKWKHLIELIAFIPPFGIVVYGIVFYFRARLGPGNFEEFNDFVKASLRENSFDELNRIVSRNKTRISDLSKKTLLLMYDSRIVSNFLRADTWFPLELLGDEKMLESLGQQLHIPVDTTVREMFKLESSPLHEAVFNSFGGKERIWYSHESKKLNELTFQNPEWYTKTSADYTLLIVACEAINSGRLDEIYNHNGRSYEWRQGKSSRANCPIWLSLKTQVLAIQEGIAKNSKPNYCVSNLADLFHVILPHSKYDPMVWKDEMANPEFPTPYAYLLYEICSDYNMLSRDCICKSHSGINRSLGVNADDLAQSWTRCIEYISKQYNKNVGQDFQEQIVRQYLEFILQLKFASYEILPDRKTQGFTDEATLFLNKLKFKLKMSDYLRNVIMKVADTIDYTHYNHQEGKDWLLASISAKAS